MILPGFFFLLSGKDSFAIVPVAAFSANNLVICSGQSTTFTNSSTGTITSYSWNFGSGASPATANTIGPHTVTYSTTGLKTVTLTVTGPDGNSTITKSEYISVGFERIKLMSYNLLNYPDNDGGSITNDTTARNPHYRTIMAAANPDILVVEEILNSAGVNGFLSNVLNASSNTYTKGVFIDGYDSDNAIFFKTSKFTFISNTPILTELRNISEFKLKHNLTGDTLRIYAVHLKASDSPAEEAQRGREVDSLRKVTNLLPAGKNFIVCGDFNFYDDAEIGYLGLKLNNAGDDGNFIDPINLSGTWNNAAYAIYHTQSSRGGAAGGLDDRFDMILYSTAISQAGGMSYVNGSLTAFGNDGNHHNLAINDMPNTAVSTAVANALFFASDHIPVLESFDYQLSNCQAMDFGVTTLVNPVSPACPKASVPLQVRIKNYGATTVNFASTNIDVALTVSDPSSTVTNYSLTLNSGTLVSGATMDVTFTPNLNMSIVGNYTFNANTILSTDVNLSNDAMAASVVNVSQVGTTTITPSGPTTFCSGSSVMLTAPVGSSYNWSNATTTQTITVSASGSYSVVVTDVNGCIGTASPVTVTVNQFQQSGNVFSENMGTVNLNATVAIATHESNNGFQNTTFTMSGTSDVRNNSLSSAVSDYPSASGSAHIFFSNTAVKNFLISGINTSGYNNLQLSFGIRKEQISSDGSDFLVQVSQDGANFTNLTFPMFSTGSGTSIWRYVIAAGTIPSTSNLRIQFVQSGTTNQYRLDDILLTYSNPSPTITAQGPTTFCQGGFVTLSASTAVSYLWSNGFSTQNVLVTTSGSYSVVETSSNGCTASSNVIPVSVNPSAAAAVSVVANPGNSICAGNTVSFTASPVNGGTSPSYQWKIGSTNVGTNSPVYSTSSLTNGNVVTCVMTSNAACVTGNPATSNAITMSVSANLTPSISISANPGNTICDGTSVTYSASPVNGGTTPVYQWKKGITNVGNGTTSLVLSSPANGDAISCIMTSNANCLTTTQATSNTITMTVNPQIAASISITANPGNTICPGTNVTFTATAPSGITAPSYQWTKNGFNTGTNSNTYNDNNLSNNDVISCVLNSSQSCVTPGIVSSNSISMNVIISDDNNACTLDACDPPTGSVSHTDVITEDNNACTLDACNTQNGAISHTLVNTDDSNPCTIDGCDSVTGIYHNPATEICGNGIDDNCNGFTDEGCSSITLNIKLFIEGFYQGNGIMTATVDPLNFPSLCDTIVLELHASSGIHALALSIKGTIDINGNGTFSIPSTFFGNSYYLAIKHRNALETWSAVPVLFNTTLVTYIFSDAASKAYGNNQSTLGDGNFAFLSGDISDAATATVGIQDGVIESQDYGDMENAVSITLLGYTTEDITGDGVVESSDYGLIEGNVYFTFVAMRP